MTQRKEKQISFLCTSYHFRGRFAECFFNSVAGGIGLAWRATSRSLALERGVGNVGPMAAAALDAVKRSGVCIGREASVRRRR